MMSATSTKSGRLKSQRPEKVENTPALCSGDRHLMMPLGELCVRRIENVDPHHNPDKHFQYVDISSIDNTRKLITEPKLLLGRDAPSRARISLRRGDVLVSTTRPNLNAVALVPEELHGQVASTGFCVLRALPDLLDQDFLFAFVQSSNFVEGLADLVKGALYPAVNDSQVFSRLIPLPPLAEQRRLAARLRGQLTAVAEARAALQAQLKAVAALPAAYLREVFGAKASSLSRNRLGDVLRLRNDIAHPRDKPTGKTRFVGLEHIEPHTGRRIGEDSVQFEDLTGRKARFEKGDIVYGYLRPYLNKVWLADFAGICSVDQYVYRVREDVADAAYVASFMRSPCYLTTAPTAATPGQLPRIRTEEVAKVLIPLPPLPEQRAIAARLDDSFARVATLRASLEARLAAVDRLPAALLREVFGG